MRTFIPDAPIADANRFTTIDQRSSCYELIASTIEHGASTPTPVRAIRFFHAAKLVTLRSMLGVVEIAPPLSLVLKVMRCAQTSPATKAFVGELNARLFAINLDVLHKLLRVWKQPQRPDSIAREIAIDAWDFDLMMVEREQAEVTAIIAMLRPGPAVLGELNRLYGPTMRWPVAERLHPMGISRRWADVARAQPFDFFDEDHRIITCKAIVTMLHRRPASDLAMALTSADARESS